jgi:amino acid adenylation domain-containing protein
MNLHELVARSAARYPSRVAVNAPPGPMTYAGLDQMANGIAQVLAARGVGRADRVIVWDDKSAAAIAAAQAVLRIGAAYVPADGATPPPRLARIAADCAANAVCTTKDRLACVPPGVYAMNLGDAEPATSGPVASVAPDDLAYILYTSGSTGVPKGVCISHRNARSFVDWVVETLRPGPDDRFANHAPLTFDISVLDLYTAFASGASVHLIPRELGYAPVQLTEFMYRHEITVWYSVPSALTLMMRDGGLLDAEPPRSLRAMLFAGEPFGIRYVRELRAWSCARLLNLYGPTETNVCTAHEVTAEDLRRDRPVPIGKAVSGDQVWAQTPDGRVAAPGEAGELVVDGPTVMLGYWGSERHRGPYRTGDLVRVLPDGSFDYLGRLDHMVKVRGHRIEPGELETVITAHPDVAEAAVVVRGTGVDARLEAYVVARRGRHPGVLTIKRHLAERLPLYMIADTVHIVSGLPRTRTGKTDRAALGLPAAGKLFSKQSPKGSA